MGIFIHYYWFLLAWVQVAQFRQMSLALSFNDESPGKMSDKPGGTSGKPGGTSGISQITSDKPGATSDKPSKTSDMMILS